MVVVVGAFLLWDYSSERRAQLSRRQDVLRAEAESVLSAVMRMPNEPQAALQGYIDDVCARMRGRYSPGHHIVLAQGERVLQATVHHISSDAFLAAVRAAADIPDGLGTSAGQGIVVGAARRDGASVFVSESVTDVEHLLRGQIQRRVLSIAVLSLVLGLVANVLVTRLGLRPLNDLVKTVRRMAKGEVGIQAPRPATTELGFLVGEFNAMSSALAKVEQERNRQMEKAHRIQNHLIPSGDAGLGLSVASIYKPADFVAGDYFDFRQAGGGVVVFCVADVSGHGVPAALLAAMLKALFLSACEFTAEPHRILAFLNERLGAATLSEDFATMIVVSVDQGCSSLRYASAGHEPAYLLHRERQTTILGPTGPILAASATSEWEERALAVGAGDCLVMLTDGLAELASEKGELFGRDRVRGLFEGNRGQPLAVLRDRLMETADEWRGTAKQEDDLTVLAVQF
jgi:sigma-B regulation protein RsbU (phosphoserine phosphatase)